MLAVVLWGGNAIVAKASADLIGAVHMTFYRWLLATAILAPFAITALVRSRADFVRQLPSLTLLSLLGCVLFPVLMYLAARDTSAINIGVIQVLTPLVAVVLSRLLFRTAIAPAALFGMALSLIGVVVVVTHGRPAEIFANAPNRGDLMMLAATICFALYSLFLERKPGGLPRVAELFVQSAVATVALIPVFGLSSSESLNLAALPLIGYAAVFASIVAPLLWINGVSRLGSARAIPYFSLLPLVTAILAVGLLGEPIDCSLVLGGVLVVAGVAIGDRAARA